MVSIFLKNLYKILDFVFLFWYNNIIYRFYAFSLLLFAYLPFFTITSFTFFLNIFDHFVVYSLVICNFWLFVRVSSLRDAKMQIFMQKSAICNAKNDKILKNVNLLIPYNIKSYQCFYKNAKDFHILSTFSTG